jgi:hypothetical protein
MSRALAAPPGMMSHLGLFLNALAGAIGLPIAPPVLPEAMMTLVRRKGEMWIGPVVVNRRKAAIGPPVVGSGLDLAIGLAERTFPPQTLWTSLHRKKTQALAGDPRIRLLNKTPTTSGFCGLLLGFKGLDGLNQRSDFPRPLGCLKFPWELALLQHL